MRWWQKTVYIVRDSANLVFVIKVFNYTFSDREKREVNIYERYIHIPYLPKIIKIEDFHWETVIFEEYIEWGDLSSRCLEFAWNNEKIKVLLFKIISILKPLWEDGIVHRDIKPENIIVDHDGNPYILDFWIARELTASTFTPTWWIQPRSIPFVSPEQLFGEREHLDARSDFFNLGIMVFWLYYNSFPFWVNEQEVMSSYNANPFALPKILREDDPFYMFLTTVLQRQPYDRPRNSDNLITLI